MAPLATGAGCSVSPLKPCQSQLRSSARDPRLHRKEEVSLRWHAPLGHAPLACYVCFAGRRLARPQACVPSAGHWRCCSASPSARWCWPTRSPQPCRCSGCWEFQSSSIATFPTSCSLLRCALLQRTAACCSAPLPADACCCVLLCTAPCCSALLRSHFAEQSTPAPPETPAHRVFRRLRTTPS